MRMKRFVEGAMFAAGVMLPVAAHAQFRLDDSPSGQRAANAVAGPAKPDLNKNRLNPLSPLGGPQGAPGGTQPSYAPATPMQSASSYAGIPTSAPPRPAIGAGAGVAVDSTVDDPSRPRQPLKPGSLKRGVAPRP